MAGLIERFLAWRREVSGVGKAPLEPELISGGEEQGMAVREKPKEGGWLTRWRGRNSRAQQMATLQEGFGELVDMTRSIRDHLDSSVQTQQALLESLQHLPETVKSLKGLGKATEQQTETLSLLRRQLEASARSEEHMAESMRSFHQTLKLMDDLSKHTSSTVSTMADRTRDAEELLRSILERSERRMITVIVILTLVTLTVLGAGVYMGLSSRSSVLPPPAPQVEAVNQPLYLPQKSIAELQEEAEPEPVLEPEDQPEAVNEDLLEAESAEPASAGEIEAHIEDADESESEEPVAPNQEDESETT